MAAEEAALVERCLRGEPRAVLALVQRFQADVYGMCLRMLHHHQDAEDAAQEVFLRLFRSLGTWDRQRPLRPWIMAIAINRCRTWIAKRMRRPRPSAVELDDLAGPAAEPADELLTEIAEAVAELRPDHRSVFVLFHYQGQGYDDIALAIDRPVGTVKTWLHRARQAVLERLRRRGMVSEIEHEMP